jgi:hypothetical protein
MNGSRINQRFQTTSDVVVVQHLGNNIAIKRDGRGGFVSVML